MPSAIQGISSTPVQRTPTKTLGSGDFMNLMITQLTQQDPLDPTNSNELLNQMAQISTLQSNADMQTSLAGLTLQQSIGAGGNLIGKTIKGIDPNGNSVDGVVTSIRVANKKVHLELDTGRTLPLENVTQIAQTAAPAAAVPGPSATQALTDEQRLQQMLDAVMNSPAGQQKVQSLREAYESLQ
jgi:flagellar basal-body rod modification protein FlgD